MARRRALARTFACSFVKVFTLPGTCIAAIITFMNCGFCINFATLGSLIICMPRFNISGIAENALHYLNLAWHRLDAWPDVPPGMSRLRRRHLLAPCSNGNISLMVDVARRNGIHWDAILGSEIAGDYKPKPRVYLASCAAFDLAPGECMMVAAHSKDLQHAAACGLRTAHIARPNEHGPGKGEPVPKVAVDYAATSLEDLAKQLGV